MCARNGRMRRRYRTAEGQLRNASDRQLTRDAYPTEGAFIVAKNLYILISREIIFLKKKMVIFILDQ